MKKQVLPQDGEVSGAGGSSRGFDCVEGHCGWQGNWPSGTKTVILKGGCQASNGLGVKREKGDGDSRVLISQRAVRDV